MTIVHFILNLILVGKVFEIETDLNNEMIVVTDGAQGIGFQIARNYLRAPAKVAILLDINKEKSNEAVEELTTELGPNKAVFIKCNVAKDLEETYQNIYNKYGILDVLINNAGLGDEEIPETCGNVNLTATVKCSLKFMELMKKM